MSSEHRAAVASGHPVVSEVAAEILRAGGSAVDAVLASGFAACVAEPLLASLGGGGFLLSRSPSGEAVLTDFFTTTPGLGSRAADSRPHFEPVTIEFGDSAQVFNVGLGSVAVPGCLRGFLHAHERLASLPLAAILEPAIGLARDGVVLNAPQAHFIALLDPILSLDDDLRRVYHPDGVRPGVGDRLCHPELASFLEQVSEVGDGGLHGPTAARQLAAWMHAGSGLVTEEDLLAYRVVEREPLAIPYRDHVLLTNPPPARGGELIAASLGRHDAVPLAPLGWGSPEHLVRLTEVMTAIEQAAAAGGTTHISVVDARGGAASMSLSNGEGCGHLAPGTGIQLNNMLGEDDLHPDGFHAAPPGVRVASMMAPSMLLAGDELRLVVGSGGSKRIRSVMTQIVSAVVDFGLDLARAIEAPRVHWDGAAVQLEPGFGPAAIEALADRWPVNLWSDRDVYFGGVHAVDPAAGGVGDPRRGGSGLAA